MSQTKTVKAPFSAKRIASVLADYRLACESREASLMGRKEVFMGRAKFGIFGDGKEVAQLAMAKVFRPGDFRSGYYRDQTFMFAIGELTIQQYFAQLFAHPDVTADPASAGRLMNGHYATRMLDDQGALKKIATLKNSSADISPTASQMPRLVGLAYASKLFRNNPELNSFKDLSTKGNEIAFGTIGNASTSEGMFFEAINAAGVLQIPMLTVVWDDGYGISVPAEYQTTKSNISKILAGFQRTNGEKGFEIMSVQGWDYDGLCKTFEKAEKVCREEHVPVLLHVTEMTQPQGHSTSGSHERYKSKERLAWEASHDCIRKMREWMLAHELSTAEELDQVEKDAKAFAKAEKEAAWKDFNKEIETEQQLLDGFLAEAGTEHPDVEAIRAELATTLNPLRLDAVKAAKRALRLLRGQESEPRGKIIGWVERSSRENLERFSSHLHSESEWSAMAVEEVKATYSESSPLVDGREVLRGCFKAAFDRDPRVLAFGEDVGKIGDVNQGLAGLQQKYGALRVTDTGIRECTILGQGIGLALRGLRPIAEIQYLDYLLYAIQIMSDDLACLQYRTRGGQKAPLIIRTRGHRLEGVWHAGSPMGMILGSIRGIRVLVPRDMTQAAGFYNTMLKSDEPALIIECLNGYRLKEQLPDNVGEFTVPLGVPEVLREGTDVTVVTYGSMCRIVMDAAEELDKLGVSCEVIDVQSLLPFDRHQSIVASIRKTSRVVFADEDVPGGATAFMMQKVLEEQAAYQYLDSQPVTITAKEHRPAYGSDGDYFSKPNPEEVIDRIYALMQEADPKRYPSLY
ncbi:MAG: thiamine pyrophosphate-dependent enzyme [Cytophagales bacterium]|nr:thiamine pyrophosphate-dependent enzyme [Cytophagales bacterium]